MEKKNPILSIMISSKQDDLNLSQSDQSEKKNHNENLCVEICIFVLLFVIWFLQIIILNKECK